MILNSAVAFHEYMLGALLGAELTQKQGVIFRYLARLIMVIPDATIHTLRELFQREFPDKSLTTPSADSQLPPGCSLQPDAGAAVLQPAQQGRPVQAMNGGKVVLINTTKDLLKRDGCQILG